MKTHTSGVTQQEKRAFVAYDYERQTWVEGEEARKLRIVQLKETARILAGPRGAEFLLFSAKRGEPVASVAQAIANTNTRIAELEAAGS